MAIIYLAIEPLAERWRQPATPRARDLGEAYGCFTTPARPGLAPCRNGQPGGHRQRRAHPCRHSTCLSQAHLSLAALYGEMAFLDLASSTNANTWTVAESGPPEPAPRARNAAAVGAGRPFAAVVEQLAMGFARDAAGLRSSTERRSL